jgi:hypothetical protein
VCCGVYLLVVHSFLRWSGSWNVFISIKAEVVDAVVEVRGLIELELRIVHLLVNWSVIPK